MVAEQLTLIWTSEIVKDGDGRVRLVAKTPLSHMTREQAAKAIGCSKRVVSELYRMGLIEGYKPGGWRTRKDGKGSNAKVRLCSESVLRYKAAQVAAAKEWQALQA
jgi:hypothetical protein